MKKIKLLFISSILCFSFASFTANMVVDHFANVSSAEEALKRLHQDPSAILVRIHLGRLDIQRGADFPVKQKHKTFRNGAANMDFSAIPEGMDVGDFMEECANTQEVSWETLDSKTYEFRFNMQTKIIRFNSSESFERRDLQDGSVLLLERDTNVRQMIIALQKNP